MVINQEEYEVLKGLDDKWKWIVRNDEWQLEVRQDKPFKKGHVWSKEVTNHGFSNDINNDLFHFIQWNDINGHEEPYNIAELIEEYEDSKEYKDSLVIEYFMDKAKESVRFKMNDVDSIIGRLDELEDNIGRIDEVIERLDDVEVRISDLENEVESTDTSPDVAILEDEVKGIKTEIYYMRDELK